MSSVRLDSLAVFLLEQCVVRAVEPQFGGAKLWDNGGREIASEAVKRAGVPTREVTALDVCRELGLFPKETPATIANCGERRRRRGVNPRLRGRR
jgi:molybdate-binding protein